MSAQVLSNLSRKEWLEQRKLGASDAAAILGLDPFRSPYRVWAEKTGVLAPAEESEAMRLGKRLEPVIIAEFSFRTGYEAESCQKLYTCDDAPYMTATPDATVQVGAFPGLLECKATNSYQADNWKDGPPDAAHIQVMHQLACTGLDFAYVAALIGSTSFAFHRVERDDAIIEVLKAKLLIFWELVQTKTPPPMSGSDADIVAALYPTSNGSKHLTLPADAEETIRMWHHAKNAEKLAKERKEALEAQIQAQMLDAETATAGKYRVSWKTVERKPYMVQAGSYRRFSVKEAA